MAEKTLTLKDFLLANPQTDICDEIFVSERFKDNGYKFKIGAMTGEQYQRYQNDCVKVGKKGKSKFDSKAFNEFVVINHTLEPNFKDAEFIKQAGCITPEQVMYKVLRAGEIAELSGKIAALSGFDTDPEALVDDVKNS
ncbi:MAG: phage portal protein [Oscillospiraceae bacterium]|jgi:hypothetical protein|nr:phage portal protein [Oscillospiraceae bacterium]